MIRKMKTFIDPVAEMPHMMETADVIALYIQLRWHWQECLLAPSGSYEDRIESEPTANAMSDAELEIVKRAVKGDELARLAIGVHNVSTRLYFSRTPESLDY